MPAFLISFMIDPVLGAPRDWDLLSIFALPAFLFAAVILSNADNIKKKVYLLLIPILLLHIIHFASFAALNMKPEQSVDRIVHLAQDDPHYQADYYQGHRIRIFAHLISNVYKRHQEGVEFLEKLADEKEIDCMSAISIGNGYANMQDYESAEKYYSRVADRCPMTSLDRMGYAKSLYMTRNFNRAIQQFKILIRDTTAVPLYSFLGHSYIFENQTDSGVKYLDIAVSISEDSTAMMESLVDVLASDGRFEPALYFQKRLLQIDPDSRLYQQRYNRLLELSGDTAQ
ncbi:MAG: hypothetical protein GF310_01920 [candidate division Zixibacteria bacterium]|nr:hypothetical protein [candidate division Zixibacteria bacterium]